jgi:hypothetical protein
MSNWNLPPGCTDADVDRAFGYKREPSELSENVRALLEKSRVISKQTMEAILEMIEEEEIEAEAEEPDPDDARDARADYEYDRDR